MPAGFSPSSPFSREGDREGGGYGQGMIPPGDLPRADCASQRKVNVPLKEAPLP